MLTGPLLALLVVGITGCSLIATEQTPPKGERTAQEIYTDFRDTVDGIIKTSDRRFRAWETQNTALISSGMCNVDVTDRFQRYVVILSGDGSPDPRETVKQMIDYFKSEGYTIVNVFDFSETSKDKGSILKDQPQGPTRAPTPPEPGIRASGKCTSEVLAAPSG